MKTRIKISKGHKGGSMDNKELVRLLRGAPLFSRLGAEGLGEVLAIARQKKFSAGTKIVAQGSTGVGFYLVLTGSAQVSRGGERIAELGTGTFFGEMCILDGAPRSADVIAVEDTTCLILRQWDIRSVISRNPDVAMAMLEELSRRLRKTEYSLS